jgi:hypothetical protein
MGASMGSYGGPWDTALRVAEEARLDNSATLDQVEDQHHDCNDQQQVNHPAHGVRRHNADKPKHNQ